MWILLGLAWRMNLPIHSFERESMQNFTFELRIPVQVTINLFEEETEKNYLAEGLANPFNIEYLRVELAEFLRRRLNNQRALIIGILSSDAMKARLLKALAMRSLASMPAESVTTVLEAAVVELGMADRFLPEESNGVFFEDEAELLIEEDGSILARPDPENIEVILI